MFDHNPRTVPFEDAQEHVPIDRISDTCRLHREEDNLLSLIIHAINVSIEDDKSIIGRYLDAEGVEHHGVQGSETEVKYGKLEVLKPTHYLDELVGPLRRQDSDVRVRLDQGHLDVGQRRQQLVLRLRVVVSCGVAPAVLGEGEELSEGRGIDPMAVAAAAPASAVCGRWRALGLPCLSLL